MQIQFIKIKVISAINRITRQDKYLLLNDLNERSICHRLALYLEKSFRGFNIDCEYNGNIDAPNGRKEIFLLRDKAIELDLLKRKDKNNDELFHQLVYPDIIVHRRGFNGLKNNILIIEVKKKTNRETREWDFEKLRRFTSSEFGNKFCYSLGVFIDFDGQYLRKYDLKFYQNGKEIEL